LHVSLPGPQRLAAIISGTQPPTPGGGDAFIHRLRDSYQPRPLPLKVEVFAPADQLPSLERLWRFYGRHGVRCHPLFSEHMDFCRPELMPELAAALERVLAEVEAEPGAMG
ncbi:MAG: hypothetical protein ACKOPN_13220, partial [Prochlorococcaceae cyanobacterium]